MPSPDNSPEGDVCAVVLAAGPPDLLDKTVRAVRAQSRSVQRVIVVQRSDTPERSNGSAPPSLGEVTVERLAAQAGRAAAFGAGMRSATADGAQWLWLLDGFTVPALSAL